MTIFSLSQKPIFLLKMRTRLMDNDSNTGGNVRYIFISFTRTWNHFIYSIKSQIIINKSVLRIFCGKCGWVLIQLWMVETCLKCSYSGLSVTTMFEIDFLILFSSKKTLHNFSFLLSNGNLSGTLIIYFAFVPICLYRTSILNLKQINYYPQIFQTEV